MKVVLAFSGGLDTTYCAKYLSEELGHEVIAVTINTGGFSIDDQTLLEKKAKMLGVSSYFFIDCTEDFYQDGIRYLLFGNVLKNNSYPLSVSAERVFQAKAIAGFALEVNADAIAHGSTGAGNDQIRFDTIFHSMCPEMKIITPIRDNQISRKSEIHYLQEHGVAGEWEKAAYSINQGLWGTSVGGKETLTSNEYLPEGAYPSQLTKDGTEIITIDFEHGEPVAINGETLSPAESIRRLQSLASPYAIGRDTHVGDTIIGIKGRVGFEAAAPLILIKAHHLLEKHVLSKFQLRIKDQLAAWYGDLMHEGNYLDPAMRDMESFLVSSQDSVSGSVEVLLAPYRFQLLGITSDHDLMDASFGKYGEENTGWNAEEAKGFAKILATQMKIQNAVNNG